MADPAIDFFKKGDISQYMQSALRGERAQSLNGFDDDYVDIVDYIIHSTHKIWEEAGLGRIYEHYQHNAIIWTSEGLTYSRDQVIAASARTQSAFPDGRLYGGDVIWAGNDVDGFHTSHRIMWTGRNTGYTAYAPPTGRKLQRWGIANCFVRANRVVEEWIARDEMSLILQLGLDPHETARRIVAQESRTQIGKPSVGEVERVLGETTPEVLPPPTGEFDPEDLVRRMYHETWNWRRFNLLNQYFTENYLCHGASGRELYGRGDLRAFILAMSSAFSDLKVSVDHVYWNGNAKDGYRVATRWTWQGTHDGLGIYGEPSGARIRIMGINHQWIRDGKIVEDWMIYDEFALLKQIYRVRVQVAG
jgi:predicted ester cyclase